MSTRTLVNLEKPPYSEWLVPNNQTSKDNPGGGGNNKGTAGRGQPSFLDKAYADQLVSICKNRGIQISYNDTFRGPGASGSKTSVHREGLALDTSGWRFKGDKSWKAGAEAQYHLYATTKGQMEYGGVINPTYDNKSGQNTQKVTIKTSDGKELLNEEVNYGDRMHFQANGARGGVNRDAYYEALIQEGAIENKSDYSLSKSWVSRDDGDVHSITIDTESGKVTNVERVTKAEAKEKAAAKTPLTDEERKNAEAFKDTYRNSTVVIDKKPGKMMAKGRGRNKPTKSFAPNKPYVPKNLVAGLKYDEDTEAGLAALDSCRDDYQASLHPIAVPSVDRTIPKEALGDFGTIYDKMKRNRFSSRTEIGWESKYQNSPASIRLSLDELHKDKRTSVAKDRWSRWEKSGILYIDNFILTGIQSSAQEIYEVLFSLGEEYKLYFKNPRPEILKITGTVLNSYNQQWLYDFRYFYENFLRGSKALENRIRAFLSFTDAIYEIFLVSFNYQIDANLTDAAQISIDCVVSQWIPIGDYQDPLNRRLNDDGGARRTRENSALDNASTAQTRMTDKTKDTVKKVSEQQNTGATTTKSSGSTAAGNKTTDTRSDPATAKATHESLKKGPYGKMMSQIMTNLSEDPLRVIADVDPSGLADAFIPKGSTVKGTVEEKPADAVKSEIAKSQEPQPMPIQDLVGHRHSLPDYSGPPQDVQNVLKGQR